VIEEDPLKHSWIAERIQHRANLLKQPAEIVDAAPLASTMDSRFPCKAFTSLILIWVGIVESWYEFQR
jgi:hypothetical protein